MSSFILDRTLSIAFPFLSAYIRPMRWSYKPTVFNGQAVENDFTVLRDGVPVGRIGKTWLNRWHWASWCHPARHDYVDTKEQALEAVRKAVSGLPDPAHLR